jgi:hypothetical protein
MSRRKLRRLTPAQLHLLPREINERTEGGNFRRLAPASPTGSFFAPVCRRKIILLHLLLFDRFAQLSELSVSLRSAVAMPFPKPLYCLSLPNNHPA